MGLKKYRTHQKGWTRSSLGRQDDRLLIVVVVDQLEIVAFARAAMRVKICAFGIFLVPRGGLLVEHGLRHTIGFKILLISYHWRSIRFYSNFCSIFLDKIILRTYPLWLTLRELNCRIFSSWSSLRILFSARRTCP